MAAGYTHSTGSLPELLYPGLADLWGLSYEQMPTKYTGFMTVKNSDKRFEKEQGFAGFSTASVKDEGDSVAYARINQGFQKEYVHTTYGLGAIITREMMEDDQYGVIQQVPRLLAEAMRRTEEVVSHATLNNGFDAAFTGADGQSLFSTAHPYAGTGGGTWANRPTTASDLTQTSLEAAIIAVRDFRDENGQRAVFEPKKLIVSNNDAFVAQKILKTEYKVGSADNDVNIISSLGLELIISNYLTDTDAWFLQNGVMNGLTFYRRRAAGVERDNDVSTQNLAIVTTTRFDVGWTDPRDAYGNPGI
jgi:phage major head subunit gpT-like protein